MANAPDRSNDLVLDDRQDSQATLGGDPVAPSASRWHRPVVTVIPLKMTLLASGISFDGAIQASSFRP